MFAIGALIGLTVIISGISFWHWGLNPTTLAVIGLPTAAAVHSVQDMDAIRNERLYELNHPEAITADSEYYSAEAYPEETFADVVALEPESVVTIESIDRSKTCPNSELYLGTWRYTRIAKNGLGIAKLTENDTLYFSNTNSFKYDIESLNKHAQGMFTTVEVNDSCSFEFRYLSFQTEMYDTIRNFNIEYIDGDSLCISEGPLTFEYKRK